MHHGKKKADAIPPSPEQQEQVRQGRKLIHAVLQLKKKGEFSDETLRLTEKVLRINPEFATFWNYRRQILLQFISTPQQSAKEEHSTNCAAECSGEAPQVNEGSRVEDGADGGNDAETKVGETKPEDLLTRLERANDSTPPSLLDGASKVLQREMTLCEEALAKVPKSYCVWHHRLWTVEQSLIRKCADLENELALCEQFFKLDDRNFHCWGHRQLILLFLEWEQDILAGRKTPGEVKGRAASHGKRLLWPVEKEMEYTRKLILRNFSNYSAWHLRSLHATHWNDFSLENELNWISDGLFTEPRDLSLWQYYEWVLLKRDTKVIRVLSCAWDTTAQHFIFIFSELCELDTTRCTAASQLRSQQQYDDEKQIIEGEWTCFLPAMARNAGHNDRLIKGRNASRLADRQLSHCWIWRPKAVAAAEVFATRVAPANEESCGTHKKREKGACFCGRRGVDDISFELKFKEFGGALPCSSNPSLASRATEAIRAAGGCTGGDEESPAVPGGAGGGDENDCEVEEVMTLRYSGHICCASKIGSAVGVVCSETDFELLIPTEEEGSELSNSSWSVRRVLLCRMASAMRSIPTGVTRELLEKQMHSLGELRDLEPECVEVLHARCRLRDAIHRGELLRSPEDEEQQLMVLDPMRVNMYKATLAKRTLRKRFIDWLVSGGATTPSLPLNWSGVEGLTELPQEEASLCLGIDVLKIDPSCISNSRAAAGLSMFPTVKKVVINPVDMKDVPEAVVAHLPAVIVHDG